MSKAYVLHSGGLDSSVCLGIAIQQFGFVQPIGILYGQRHTKELEVARELIDHLQYALRTTDRIVMRQRIINLAGVIGKGGLTDPNLVIPNTSYDDLPVGVSPTYVPFRNGLILSAVASIAAVDKECEAIFYGAHAEDAKNWAYPDCSPEFIGGMANAIYIGTYRQIRLHTPLMFMTKAEVVLKGHELDTPFDLTWSCYKGEELHCGECPTCIARKSAFIQADIVDPTEYKAN